MGVDNLEKKFFSYNSALGILIDIFPTPSAFEEVKDYKLKADGDVPEVSSFHVLDSVKSDFYKFNQIIDTRKIYIHGLKNLDEDWISGGGAKPDEENIEFSSNLLEEIRIKYIAELVNFFKMPKLIMGPIPSGGLSFEFRMSNESSIYINVYNKKKVELCKKINDTFSPEYNLSLDLNKVKDEVIDFISAHGYRNTEWRYFI